MNTYLLFKSLHLIAVISWMAGLLYLPRIFVYHVLFFYIMTPAMALSWVFGLILIHEIGFQQLGQKWMILKLIFVTSLTLYHFYLGRVLVQFKLGINKHSSKYYRYINEIPTLLLILIIFIVIFKPI